MAAPINMSTHQLVNLSTRKGEKSGCAY